jgi:hypothetical protein
MQNKYRKQMKLEDKRLQQSPFGRCFVYTEAESRINEEMSAYISEEFKITNIKVANYAEIHPLKIVIAGLNQNFFTGL